MKQVHITTFGCQMNERDSLLMAQILARHDYHLTEQMDQADLILVNTCSIRQKAEEKTYSLLGRLKGLKKKNPRLVIGVGGCVAQQEGRKLLDRVPHLDLVFGTKLISRLPELLEEVQQRGARFSQTDLDQPLHYPVTAARLDSTTVLPFKASVTIMQGCNNYCAYCVVPYVRGAEESRPIQEILTEVKNLVAQGIKEILLLGQNVNSYGLCKKGRPNFAQLLYQLEAVPGLDRIRFTTSHPKNLSPELISCFGSLSKLCEHIHLPVQAGSNPILERMNRRYSRENYLDQVASLRERCPEIAISSDVMVGFPGESEQDFEQTLSLLKTVRFDDLFSFKYSDRPMTQARGFSDKVADAEKSRRLKTLQALQREITLSRNRELEGTRQAILVEGPSRRSSRELSGRTRTNKTVNFSGPADLLGKTVWLAIDKAFVHSLRGIPWGGQA